MCSWDFLQFLFTQSEKVFLKVLFQDPCLSTYILLMFVMTYKMLLLYSWRSFHFKLLQLYFTLPFFFINLEYHKYQRLHDIDVFLLILTTSVIDTFPIFSRHPWGGGSKACDGLCPRWLVHRRHRQHDGWQRSGKLRQRHCHHPQLPARSTG